MSFPQNTNEEVLPAATVPPSTDPIFILGITQRSGTNFLFDLLCLHPDCGAPAINWEDFLVAKSDLLVGYVSSVFSGWRRRGTAQEVEALLYQQLGNGLLSVLASRIRANRLVTKTPSVRNLDCFFKLFPRAYLLILVRDGRAVVESRVKSFGESYETAMRIWAEGADTILRFVDSADGLDLNYLIVRYEDLWHEPERELRRIFAVTRLDPDKYAFSAATSLPVRGSSVFHGQENKEVHWKPVEKTAEFNPVSRSNHWSRANHERFNWIAGDRLVRFGYNRKRYKDKEFLWMMWNRVLDLGWYAREFLQAAVKLVKDTLKWAFGADRVSKCRRQVLGSIRTIFNLKRVPSHQ
jgi:hypothetical protein